ncbi:thioesterase II family protein [Nocardiopsis synnemataformans]|uniref:thioesterase II family protein n=1 Tax=Nocardiopsis synnemataformans TaxID=61305 RepID=UPI003EBF2D9D
MDDTAWIARLAPAPNATARLVCFPHAGGAASYFHPLSAELAPEYEALTVQYPGRQERYTEEPIDDIEKLADEITPHVRRTAADLPFAFFGHSMGATVAFEVACRLEADGGPAPVSLFLSGRLAPSRHRPRPPHKWTDRLLLAEVGRLNGVRYQQSLLRDPGLRALILPALRADYNALETYVPDPGARVRAPITAMVGERDPLVSVRDIEAWRTHTESAFAFQMFSGGHFYLGDHMADIASMAQKELGRIAQR